VVRTRKIGHFFPGGTLDSFDIWLELQAAMRLQSDLLGGQVEDGGKGPVEPGAHFYKAFQLDADGNQINKRNAWQARSVLYVHAIQPGAADTVHYLLNIPKDAKGRFTDHKTQSCKFSCITRSLLTPGNRSRGKSRRSSQSQRRRVQFRQGQYSG